MDTASSAHWQVEPTDKKLTLHNFLSMYILRQGSTTEISNTLTKVLKYILQHPDELPISAEEIYNYLELTYQVIVQLGETYTLPYDYRIKLIHLFTNMGNVLSMDIPDNLYEILGTKGGNNSNSTAPLSSDDESNGIITTKEGGYITYRTNTSSFPNLPLYTYHIWSSVLMSDIADRLWPAAFTIINAVYFLHQFSSSSTTPPSSTKPTNVTSSPNNPTNFSISSIFTDRTILELGSGTGLAGSVITMIIPDIRKVQITDVEYHAYTKMVAFQKQLTDSYPTILKSSSSFVNTTDTSSRLGVALLDWCKLAHDIDRHPLKPLDWIYENVPSFSNVVLTTDYKDDPYNNPVVVPIPPASIMELRSQFNVIIGSDLVYDPLVIPQLCQTLESLLIPLVHSPAENIPRIRVSTIFSPTSSPSSLSVSVGSLTALHELLSWISKYRIRYSILSTTYRNPSTYALLQEQIQRSNLTYIEISIEIGKIMTNNSSINLSSTFYPHVLDTRPITDELIYKDIIQTLQRHRMNNHSFSYPDTYPSSSTGSTPGSIFDERTALILHNKYIEYT